MALLSSTAQGAAPSVIDKIKSDIVQPIIYLLIAVAVGYFLFGLMEFVRNQDNDEAQTDGKRHMLWGIIGLAIMFSVYGILSLINNTVGGLTS
ncbi:MAG: hypothetical protein HZB12_02330 [Candidatus Yonathbacteria bacterium]|nr:hypothetical protein [Candidatus Yonathbacteria bacterium]